MEQITINYKELLRESLSEAEKSVILAAYRANNFSITKTAQALEFDRKTLYNRALKLGIDLKAIKQIHKVKQVYSESFDVR